MVRFVRRHWIAAVWMLFGAVIVYAARPYWWNGIIDTRARRDLYEQLPKFPQAHEVDSNRYRIPGGDGGMSNHFGLTVTYRLPDETTTVDVQSFFRENLPDGWIIADDALCTAEVNRVPPPPAAPLPDGSPQAGPPRPAIIVQTYPRSEMTLFRPGTDLENRTRNDGVGITLKRNGNNKLMTFGSPGPSCIESKTGAPADDPAADEFDR
jgi:hypothetical protein